jgi:predicted AlkP superfamily phosphohydrolase/phosphomutase
MPAAVPRVLFLGLDGGTMAALGPLFGRGELPHLAAFWRRAAHGRLRSTTPMVTPVAWASFLTGCTPRRHGIHEFHRLDPQRPLIHTNRADRIAVPTLWQHLAEAGREVVSLGLPMTYPAPSATARGLVVAGSDAPTRASAFAQCPDFGRLLAARLPDYTHKNLWKVRPRTLAELEAVAARTARQFQAQAEAALLADACVDWSALMVHFHNLDGLQHRVWPELDLGDGPPPDPSWRAAVRRCLRALDAACGRRLELAARRDAAVIAVSDHGFGPCRALVHVNGLLAEAGLQRRLAYGTRYRYRLHRLRDRWARWRSRRDPEAAANRPRAIAGEVGCDWRRTVAYAPFGQLCACVVLHPATLRDDAPGLRLRGEIVELLRAARDPETDDPLFADAFDVAEHYGLDPRAEGLPDVLAPSADGYQAQAKWSPFDASVVRPDPELPATHRLDGIVAIDAPGVRPGGGLRARLEDLAPTTLALLDLPRPEVVEGQSLLSAVAAAPPSGTRPGRPAAGRAVSASVIP